MSDGGSTAEEIPDQAFRDLLSKGKSRGSLSQDEVVDVLKSVELTHDLIDDVRHRLAIIPEADGTEAVLALQIAQPRRVGIA